MTQVTMPEPPVRHAWIDEFLRDPVKGLGDLLAGYARIHPYDRADPPDAARMLFGPLPQDDPARLALSGAIPEWLARRRRQAPPSDRPRLGQWIAEIREVFEIVAALDLTGAAVALRRQFVALTDWTARFVLSPARDARAAYWRMLALTQPIVARSPHASTLASLAPVWMDICRKSGGILPQRYLAIGLLGLRRLMPKVGGSEDPWVAGMAHWAMEQNPSAKAFQAEWLALKPLYPRTPGRWRELVSRLLDTPAFKNMDNDAVRWWRADVKANDANRRSPSAAGGRLRSPSPGDCEAEVEQLPNPWTRVEPRIDQLMQRHRTYLAATGEHRFFVRAIHVLGQALIRGDADQSAARAHKAQTLAREGLSWEPSNRFLWSLWRDALEAEGALEAAERVGWEFVRRDPDNPDARDQLAALLAGPLGRADQAETLLRDTIAAFPTDAVARAQLATLLAGPLGRADQAEALLRDTIVAFPTNAVARNQLAELLISVDRVFDAEAVTDAAFAENAFNEVTYAVRARLLSHRGRLADAMAAVAAGRQRDPTNGVLRTYENLLAEGRSLPLRSAATRGRQNRSAAASVAIDDSLDGIARFGRLRQLRARVELGSPTDRQAALEEIEVILRDDPSFAYARLLAERYGVGGDWADAMPGFAVAFERALSMKDRTRLEELAQRQPRLQALTLLACAVLGDEQAGWTVALLVNEDPAKDEAEPVKFLRHRVEPLFRDVDRGRVMDIVAANDAMIRRCLRDAVEATIGDRDLAA